MQVAGTIREQLLALTPQNVILSWGIRDGFKATVHNEMASLWFGVNARLFSGEVIIAYNAMDYYEVYLHDSTGFRLELEEVYFDQLGELIDELIEVGPNQEEYEKFCTGEYEKLLRGEFD